MKNYYKCNSCKATLDSHEDIHLEKCPNCYTEGSLEDLLTFTCKKQGCGYTECVTDVNFKCPLCERVKNTKTPITSSNKDKGAHYRYMHEGVKLDPYRVCKLFIINGGPHEHMTKKILRGSGKGHSEDDLIKELQCCLDRWKEMIEEDVGEYMPTFSLTKEHEASYRFKGVQFSHEIVCEVYEINSDLHKEILKNLLYNSGEGHTEEDLVKELQRCLDRWKADRWKEMIEEDKNA